MTAFLQHLHSNPLVFSLFFFLLISSKVSLDVVCMAAFSRISEHWFNDQRVLVSRIRKQCWQAGFVSIHPSLALPEISSSWDAAPVHPQSCSPALGHEGTEHPPASPNRTYLPKSIWIILGCWRKQKSGTTLGNTVPVTISAGADLE